MKRIQRKRVKGWRMPINTLYVGRPSKWGNPLMLSGNTIYIDAGYRRTLSPWVILQEAAGMDELMHYFWVIATPHPGYQKFVDPDLQHWSDHFASLNWNELTGKDLACWCREDRACHGDTLIELHKQIFSQRIPNFGLHLKILWRLKNRPRWRYLYWMFLYGYNSVKYPHSRLSRELYREYANSPSCP